MIRVILVDDHAIVREALRTLLEQDSSMRVVAEVGAGETALAKVEELVPDVVVMDVALPGADCIETTRRLLARQPNLRILALSTYPDAAVIRQMLDAGASGYITKSAAGVELIPGIRSVLAGHRYLCPEIAVLVAGNSVTMRE
jgi:two-component system NarL family response regulator